MVDPTFNLGRDVPTAREVLEVIRPNLRLAAVIGPIVYSTFIHNPGPDACLEGGDQAACDSVFDGLREDALRNVKDWAGDVSKVYDGAKLTEFVGMALNEVFNGRPSDAVLDVLALDDGVCESIGLALGALTGAWLPSDPADRAAIAGRVTPMTMVRVDELNGTAACYFGRV